MRRITCSPRSPRSIPRNAHILPSRLTCNPCSQCGYKIGFKLTYGFHGPTSLAFSSAFRAASHASHAASADPHVPSHAAHASRAASADPHVPSHAALHAASADSHVPSHATQASRDASRADAHAVSAAAYSASNCSMDFICLYLFLNLAVFVQQPLGPHQVYRGFEFRNPRVLLGNDAVNVGGANETGPPQWGHGLSSSVMVCSCLASGSTGSSSEPLLSQVPAQWTGH